jgi:RNA polymerase sigma factor (sigma-70 family)
VPDAPESRTRLKAAPCISGAQIREHEALIQSVAQRFPVSRADYDDLMQEGRIALFFALRDWRPEGGASFGTFAYARVMFAMRSLRQRSRRLGLTGGHGRRFKHDVSTPSMDAPVDEDGRSLHDTLGESAAQEDRFVEAEVHAQLRAAIATLPEAQRRVIEARLEGASLEMIGDRVEVSKQRIHQIERGILEKLQMRLSERVKAWH